MKVACVATHNSGLLDPHKGHQSGENTSSTMRSYVCPTPHATAIKEPLRFVAAAQRESMLNRPEHEQAERESATPLTLLRWNQLHITRPLSRNAHASGPVFMYGIGVVGPNLNACGYRKSVCTVAISE